MDDFLRQVRQLAIARGIATADARGLERDIRAQWGGSRVYIPKAPRRLTVETLAGAIATGTSAAQAIREHGLTRSWAYACLGRKSE